MAIQKKDFIEIEYTGRLKDNGDIFDTTDEKTAKDNEIHDEKMKYGPIIICVGEQQLIPGLDKEIEGKELGEYKAEIPPEDAFGKKDAKLIQLIPISKFTKQQINPVPGLQLDIDGNLGTIKTVGGGRTLVDFNHPLSGKEVVYSYKINRIIEDNKEKIISLMEMMFKIKPKIEEKEGKIILGFEQEFPEEIKKMIIEKIKELVCVDIEIIKTEKEEEPVKQPEIKQKEETEQKEAEKQEETAKKQDTEQKEAEKQGKTSEKKEENPKETPPKEEKN